MNKKDNLFSLNIPESSRPRLVVIGGGFGGLNLVKKIRTKDFQVVIFDRYNYHTFQPLLYQVATAGLEPDSVTGPLRKVIKKNKELYFRMLKVSSVDPEKKIVKTPAGELSFDYLVIATGSRINFFNNQGIAENAFPLKQITHALDLRSHIFQQFEKIEISNDEKLTREMLNFVVVGAGPTGVELCGALSELKYHVLPKDYPELDLSRMNIYLVEGLKRVLPAMSERSSKKVHNYLEKMGVKILLETMTKDYDGQSVSLDNGDSIPTATLVWAAGVKGNLIRGFPEESIEKSKYRVNEYNQVYRDPESEKAYPDIFAIGDVALLKTGKYPYGIPGLAQPAIQEGKQVAGNLSRIIRKKLPAEFRYKNKGVLATIGRNRAVAELPGGIWMGGILGWMIWMTVHLLFLIGFRNRAIVFANWVWNYFTYDRGIRLILRPSTKNEDIFKKEMFEEMNES